VVHKRGRFGPFPKRTLQTFFEWKTTWNLEITNAGGLDDLPIATGNSRYSILPDPLVVGKVPLLDPHTGRKPPCTSDVNWGHDNYSHNHLKVLLALRQTVYEQRDNLGNGSVNWSILGLHKTLARRW